MAGIDWNKVGQDYAKSYLDTQRLYSYAHKVAERLLKSNIQFDGYTDTDTKDFWGEAKTKGFFKTLIKDRTGLDYQHVGYWIIESCFRSNSGGTRVSNPLGRV